MVGVGCRDLSRTTGSTRLSRSVEHFQYYEIISSEEQD